MKSGRIMAALLVLCPLLLAHDLLAQDLLAQDPPQQPAPAQPDTTVGLPLVAWSELQKPRPIPDPTPLPDAGTSSASETNQSQPLPSSAQSFTGTIFTGTIAAENGIYILHGSESSISELKAFQIDDQEKVRGFEGKSVRIAGCFDVKTNVLHIMRIAPLSL